MAALRNDDHSYIVLLDNINKLIVEHGINEFELSKRIGIPQSTLNKLLSGNTKDPKITMVKKIANYFHTSLDQLYSENNTVSTEDKAKKFAPIISWKECLSFNKDSLENPSQYCNWVPLEYINNGNIFVLKSKVSMEPRFPNHTNLIINNEIQPNDGDIVIVKYDNLIEATIKIISITSNDKGLYNLNQSERSTLDKTTIIVGVLVESRYNYA